MPIETSCLQLKISLNDFKPLIWRKIIVPSDCSFFNLHVAIQDAMGWSDSHLHAFYISEQQGEKRITIEFPNPEANDFGGINALDERKERIADYFGKTIKQCVYCYDFGDNWDHTVLFEGTVPRKPGSVYPQCTAGKRACPPDDCGGVWGYQDLLEILKNPKHAEHKNMLDWLAIESPDEFDAESFEPREVVFRNSKKVLKAYEKGFGIK